MTSTPYQTTNTVYYGTTAPTAAATTATPALATTVFSEAKTGIFGFGSSTAAQLWRTRINQLVVDSGTHTTAINALRTQLINVGILKA